MIITVFWRTVFWYSSTDLTASHDGDVFALRTLTAQSFKTLHSVCKLKPISCYTKCKRWYLISSSKV